MRGVLAFLLSVLLLWALSEPEEFGAWLHDIKSGVERGTNERNGN